MDSYGKTISEYNIIRGGWCETPNFGCFFHLSIECVEKIIQDFVQRITNLSNDIENPLLYNYTDEGQSWINLAYCHLNSFLAIITFIHEERLGVC